MKLTGNDFPLSAKQRLKQWTIALVLAAMGLMSWTGAHIACAQALSTTTVQGTVYLANGQPGAGTLNVSWPDFTTANGQTVVADNINVTVPSDGFVSVNLTPNLGATPAGLYYTAVFYMSDGTVNTQYWVVPSSSAGNSRAGAGASYAGSAGSSGGKQGLCGPVDCRNCARDTDSLRRNAQWAALFEYRPNTTPASCD